MPCENIAKCIFFNDKMARQCSHETEAHKKMHLICIAARNDAVFFAYLVATPLHRFKCKKAFSTR